MQMHLNHNGVYLERRKMYLNFPLHNMRSKIEFNWQNQEETDHLRGRKAKLMKQAQQIKQIYTQKVDHKLQERYNRPEESRTRSQQKDILQQQIQNFNQSKTMNGSQYTPQNNPQSNYYQNEQPQYHNYNYNYSQNNKQIESPPLDSSRYHQNGYYQYDLMKEYAKYNELVNGNGERKQGYVFRNIMPDKLESFLRQKTKQDRSRAINVSLNLAKRQQSL